MRSEMENEIAMMIGIQTVAETANQRLNERETESETAMGIIIEIEMVTASGLEAANRSESESVRREGRKGTVHGTSRYLEGVEAASDGLGNLTANVIVVGDLHRNGVWMTMTMAARFGMETETETETETATPRGSAMEIDGQRDCGIGDGVSQWIECQSTGNTERDAIGPDETAPIAMSAIHRRGERGEEIGDRTMRRRVAN